MSRITPLIETTNGTEAQDLMRSKLKVVTSWVVAALSFLIGLLALALMGTKWISLGEHDFHWFMERVELVGGALFAVGLMVCSLVALRHARRAGIIFLALAPVTAFCLTYPNAGYLVWHADGGGYFEQPLPLTAMGLTLLFFAPIAALLLTLPNRRRAAIAFGSGALVAIPVFVYSRWTAALLPGLAGTSAPFALLGAFWLGTWKRGWPPLLWVKPRSWAQTAVRFAILAAAILCADIVLTLGVTAMRFSLFSPDCRGRGLFVRPAFSGHAVFTARIVFVGWSLHALLHRSEIPDSRVGDWAIGVVQERFWGLPSWKPRFVLLTNFVYWQGETYFVDGSREEGFLTRLLPIIGGGISCSRTKPVQAAAAELRVLREGTPAGGRIAGYVVGPKDFKSYLTAPPVAPEPAANAKIDVSGPSGTQVVTTDATGTYELSGLTPGDYTLRLEVPEGQMAYSRAGDGSTVKVSVKNDGLAEASFNLVWNGLIKGQIKDDRGKAAHAWVELRRADGENLPGNVRNFSENEGSYEINKIPPGRYIVLVNPYGPMDGTPYDVQYYRGAARAEGAKILELGEGEQIGGIDFTLPRVVARTVKVKVRWPNGSPAVNASVHVAYENTQGYTILQRASGIKNSDLTGLAEIRVYGRSRIRIFAEGVVDKPKSGGLDEYYSPALEYEANKTPSELELVLSASRP